MTLIDCSILQKVVVTIADACPTCKNKNSIDLSVRAFERIATKDEGEVPSAFCYALLCLSC